MGRRVSMELLARASVVLVTGPPDGRLALATRLLRLVKLLLTVVLLAAGVRETLL
jgi:hypothetical protein